jgi:membrane-associated phospholipid phosphatase
MATPLDGTGRPRVLLATVWQRFRHHVALRALGIFLLLTALGLLVAHPLDDLLAIEDNVNRYLQARRTPRWDTITYYASRIGSTEIIIGSTAVVAAVLRLLCRRWREPVFLMVSVALASTTFTLTTFPVERERPQVAHLDPAPPTSSFPSGHVGAATALYGGLALLLIFWPRVSAALGPVLLGLVLSVPLAVPVAVALARLYRGMHHISDVAVGVLNGVLCLAVAANAYLRDPVASGPELVEAKHSDRDVENP